MDYAHSQWRAGEATMQPGTEPLQKPDVLPTGLMRQEFKIEGMDTNELFFVPPYIAINDNAWITVDHAQARLRRDENLRSRRFEYTLGTTAIVNGEQSPLRPSTKFGPPPGTVASPREMPGLVALAQRWLKESGLPQQDRVGRRPLPGAAACPLGPVPIQPRRPAPRSHDRPDRGLRHRNTRKATASTSPPP